MDELQDVLGIEGELLGLEEKNIVKLGVVGCGSHMYRNILPSLRFISNAKIVATCDINEKKAKLFAKEFGAENYFDSAERLIESKLIDAVIIVVGYDPKTGKPLYPDIVPKFLEKKNTRLDRKTSGIKL